jgi:dipeptidyl aminopeptidase/acylaminoacyl peptidase
VAVFQPQFSPDGRYLAYVSDSTGWGHIYLHDLADGSHRQITEGNAEHGIPNWIMGQRQYAWAHDGRSLTYIRCEKGFFSVWRYDLNTQNHSRVEGLEEYTHFHHIAISPKGEKVALLASSSRQAARVVCVSRGEGVRVVHRATMERIAPSSFASSEAISWATEDGETAHGLYYAPTNPDYEGIGLPPLLLLVHGGPTSQRNAEYDDQVQFFTTRGYAVLQVNHRGGTGYGKPYMNKHKHNWGVYDVIDSMGGALHLAEQGLIDRDRMVILGGSAGGFTVLMMLAHYPNVFKAGVNLFGVGNQFTIALDADFKFENHYFDWLLGPLPEHAPRWRASSPAFDAHQIQDAMLVLQGSDDNVVPKSQSDEIVATLKRNGVPHEYVVYEGEGHGFRKPATIVDMYTKIDRFLKQYVVYAP